MTLNQLWRKEGRPGTYAEFAKKFGGAKNFKNFSGAAALPVNEFTMQSMPVSNVPAPQPVPGTLPATPVIDDSIAPLLNDNTVQCKDGSTDITNGIIAPCTTRGGVKEADDAIISDSAKPDHSACIKNCLFYGGIGLATGIIVMLAIKKLKK